MGLKDIIRWRRRPLRPVGQRLERGFHDESLRRKNLILKIGIFVILVFLTVAAFPFGEVFEYTVNVGDTWNKESLIADLDFSIRKDRETYELELESVRRETPPVFQKDPSAISIMSAHRDTVSAQLQRIFAAYEGYRFNRLRGRLDEARADSSRFFALRRNARLKLTPDQWDRLLREYAERTPGLSTTTRSTPTGRRLDDRVLRKTWEVGVQFVEHGVLGVPLDSVSTDYIIIRDRGTLSDTETEVVEVFGLNEAYDAAHQEFLREYPSDAGAVTIADAVFRAIFQPSLIYDRQLTTERWRQARSKISPTEGIVEQGSVIIRRGEIVTAEIKRVLNSLEEARRLRSGNRLQWRVLLGRFMVCFAAYLFFFLYLFLLRRPIFDDNAMVFLIAVLFALFVGLFAFAVRVPYVGMFVIPVAIVSVLLTVIFDSRVGLFGTFTLALIGALLLQYDFEFFFATVFAGSLGVHSVRDIKNRAQFFVSAGVVFLGYAFVLFASFLLEGAPTQRLFADFVQVGISSFFLVMAYPLLWVFERTFGLATDLTYLELSDTNRPLLKELSLNAPGTFNHSLQVSNLAEAAADAIGANALQTRVGALYHDIGKMQKPEYFVENQRPGQNPHDQLKPRMSALIIASHVKEGIEMARAANLPQQVIDFIPMHHGSSLIEYFYRRAVDNAADTDAEIRESEFRYPGPKPTSKETGILMLADSVEAASRSLTSPTHKRLETLIDSLVKSRIEDGQLENTNLTFNELNVIKDTFLSLLSGMYHVRVKYPDQDKIEAADSDDGELAEATGRPADKGVSRDTIGQSSVAPKEPALRGSANGGDAPQPSGPEAGNGSPTSD